MGANERAKSLREVMYGTDALTKAELQQLEALEAWVLDALVRAVEAGQSNVDMDGMPYLDNPPEKIAHAIIEGRDI